MKKFLSLLIWATFLFSAFSVNAYHFTNLWKNKFYYWQIEWELKKENNLVKTIYLLKEKDLTISQIFSSAKSKKIKNLFLNKNNVKILWQSYKNPNNHKYAWIFVNKIRNLDIPKIQKKKTKKEIIKISKETLKLKKYLKEYSKFNFVIKNFYLLDEKIRNEIKMAWCEKMKNLFHKENLTDSEKFLINEAKTIEWFEDFTDLRIKAINERIDDWKIIRLILSNWEKTLNKTDENLRNFLIKNNSEKIKKTAFSKDFQSKNFEWFKINFPQNFDYQEISIWNEKFSRIYLKNFYSNILSFDFNKVENFKKRIWEKSEVKISWNYWQKITSDWKIFYQIKNKSWEKFEISFPTNEKNLKEIFESILNKIWN